MDNSSQTFNFNKDAGLVKLYLRGRPVTLYLPSCLQTSDESDLGFDYNPSEIVKAPSESLKLEWVYGYRGKDCRSNLYQLPTGEIIYFIAAVAILYNLEERTQRYYLAHTDDIKSLAIHPDKITIATGQTAGHDKQEGKPHVRIWNSVDLSTLKLIGLNSEFQNSISCLSFSLFDGGEQLAIVDDANERYLSVWNWKQGHKLASTKCYGDAVLNCEYHPSEKNLIITSGKQHLIFWTLDLTCHLQRKSASFELSPSSTIIQNSDGSVVSLASNSLRQEKPKYVLCIAFSHNGEVVSGDTDGNLIFWNAKEGRITRIIKEIHEGGVFSVMFNEQYLISGGKDGKLIEWSLENLQRSGRELQIPENTGGCRVISRANGNMVLIGTTKNCIYQANFELNFMECLINSHFEELWGLSSSLVHQTNFLTCGNDKNLSYWDTMSHSLVWSVQLEEKAHCLSAHPSLELAAIGFTKAKWIVFDLTERRVIHNQLEGSEQIECIQYSPNGLYIAIGSRDNYIYIYNVSEDGLKYSRLGKCTGHSSFITHLDWSIDSQYLTSNSGDYEVLFWQVLTCKQITQVQVIREIEWSTNSCTLSFGTLGIWNPSETSIGSSIDGTDINSCCISGDRDLLVSVDDFGKVNLFKYPCASFKAERKTFNGHSSHVTNCAFVSNDSRVITTGGNDMAIFQWSVLKE